MPGSQQVSKGKVDVGSLKMDAKDFDNEHATAVIAVHEADHDYYLGRFFVRQVGHCGQRLSCRLQSMPARCFCG